MRGRGSTFPCLYIWFALSIPFLFYTFSSTGGGNAVVDSSAKGAPVFAPVQLTHSAVAAQAPPVQPVQPVQPAPPPPPAAPRALPATPASCAAAAAAPRSRGSAPSTVPLWSLAPAGLPARERRLLIALDAQLPLALRCAPAPARILLVGIGCEFGETEAALEFAKVLRLAAPWVDLAVEDATCSASTLALAGGVMRASVGAGGGDWDALILRRSARENPNVRASQMLSRVRDGGTLIIEGFSDDSAGQLALTRCLLSVKWKLHCAANGGCNWGERSIEGAEAYAFFARAKAIDCVRDVCAVHTWSDAERASQLSDGVKSLIARTSEVESARALERAAGMCAPERQSGTLFWSLGLVTGTDKVRNPDARGNTHYYHEPYARHLGPRRCEVVSFLEIGLGCDMHYPPGAAFSVYLDYFPFAHVAYMEYDATCVDKFNREDPKRLTATHGRERWSLVAGDQRNVSQLLAIAPPRSTHWDVVIDDGGHSMGMQVISLRTLLPRVAPGGLYILEDFHTSWIDWVAKDGQGGVLTTDYVDAILAAIHNTTLTLPQHLNAVQYEGVIDLAALTKAIDCSPQVCIFTRWTNEELQFLSAR